MSEHSPSVPPAPPAPIVRRGRGMSPVWIIPIVAALVGLWLVWQHYSGKGPLVEVRFETAEGVEAGKTAVQCRSVKVGVVETVRLAANQKGVVAMLRIDHAAADLLKSDTRFWVVRPRFGGAGISGLSTLVSGTFIELDPGVVADDARKFQGLENPPVTPMGVPGLRVTLVSDTAGSLGPGSSVSYKGIKVGRIESRTLNPKTGRVEFGAFINIEFRTLVTNRSRFWNVSGIGLTIGVNGFRLRTGTLDSFVSGGVAFETGEGGARIQPAKNGAEFPIYENYEETKEALLNPQLPYLLLVKDSVRGLSPDAPVEFRGIRVGTVSGISFDYLPDDPERRVPVLIKIDPHLLADLPDGDTAAATAMIAQNVRNGLRATLRTGSLLTGQLFVDLDFQKDAPPAEVAEAGGYLTLPTVSSGLGELQAKITGVLDKIQKLNLEEVVTHASGALAEIKSAAADLKGAAASLDKLLASKETQGLPGDLKKSLATLNKTIEGFSENSPLYRDLMTMLESLSGAMRSFDSLSSTIERKPSSLLWGNPKGKVSPPKGKP